MLCSFSFICLILLALKSLIGACGQLRCLIIFMGSQNDFLEFQETVMIELHRVTIENQFFK